MENQLHDHIALIGFMGVGKSTVSACLGEMLGRTVIDMDRKIEEEEGMSIPDIFETYGEAYFRSLETKLLTETGTKEAVILSCGGGVAMREENVRTIKKNGRIVLLDASPATILERVGADEGRPLLKGRKDIASIRALMEERREKYEAAADIVVSTDKKEVRQICEEIIQKLSEMDENYV